jgi:bifunctional non-homologous end joining protein LigD
VIQIPPMLAMPFAASKETQENFLRAPGHVFELKLDGVRAIACGDALQFRSGLSASSSFPEIAEAVSRLPGSPVLDGELVAFDAAGKPDFELVCQRLGTDFVRRVPVLYMVFDMLTYQGNSLEALALSERKRLLEQCFQEVSSASAVLRLHSAFERGDVLFQFCEANDLEGLVRKRSASLYHRGPKRTQEWVKLKRTQEEDFYVVAICQGDAREIGAVDLASLRDGRLYYEGRAGSGLGEAAQARLKRFRDECSTAEYALDGPKPELSSNLRTFVNPKQLVRVKYMGRGSSGVLRHGVFRGFRDDL